MAVETAMASADAMDSKIHLIRGRRVMLDLDLAVIYGVTTKQLNQQLRRNRIRLVAAIRRLLETPAEEAPRREIGFDMRETAPPYRISRRR